MDFIVKFISTLITMHAVFYIGKKLLDSKTNISTIKKHFLIAISGFVLIFNYYFTNSFIRMVVIILLILIFYKILFKENLKKTLTTSIFCEGIVITSESIFAILLIIIFGMDANLIIKTQFGNFLSNSIIAILSMIIINFKFVKNMYNMIIKAIEKIREKQVIIISFLGVIIVNILEAMLYYDIDYRYLLIFNTGLIIFSFSIIYNSFKNKTNYISMYAKYNTSLNSLKDYENILDRYRVSNHENKNQLLTIRNMVLDNDKETLKYIDSIVKNKLEDDIKIMAEIVSIPAGGLKGLIYSKILYMKNNDIKYNLNISKEIKTIDLITKLDDNTMLDICKIVGVFLDNSIQAVENIKNKIINIDIYLENKKLIIEIFNTYEGKIDLDKISDVGYSVKGKNRGYGLALVKEIIEKNKKLKNMTKITKKYFSQQLQIKL